jgi:hypothetical protein
MNMPRPLLIGLIVLVASTLGWVSYDELRRREADMKQHLQTSEYAAQLSPSGVLELLEPLSEPSYEATRTPTHVPVFSSYQTTSTEPILPNPEVLVNNQPAPTNISETPPPTPASPTASESTTEEEPPVCSSFDQAGLLATFDASLAAFIANASVSYGSQYTNLQYQLSSKTGIITGEQGTVTTGYSGTVQELSTGEAVSANGVITANFAWDGCIWQLVNYSF